MLNYKHIEFINGGNSYISKTNKDFNRLSKKYYLLKLSDNHYVAVYRKIDLIASINDTFKSVEIDKPIFVNQLPTDHQTKLINILKKHDFPNYVIDDIINSKLEDIK